ncbi:nuclear transport factor 2 family protein [Lysobacter sp. S4-A87]|uniref:nuclear transport factor 2 family protein n=1 Tax=Lysobacter sp. S4-A87 TaxID=2925843 RepID=UPI001F52E049|nr:nuclear transport factor 2 family protein [Lysobacter sp. S4-A87]UNK49976.1 nuclear transport factor 2 family protein [Lysobacter sp. S4-A87]
MTALLLVMSMLGCSRTPPEQRLRETVATLQQGIEQRDASVLEGVLAADFVGPDSLDREGAGRIARLLFLRHSQIGVNLGPVSVQLQPGHATARFTAALTGGSGEVLPDSAQLYEVETGWREEDGEWRLTSATWVPKL